MAPVTPTVDHRSASAGEGLTVNSVPPPKGQELDFQNISVLIVEGHDLMRHLLAAALRTLGCTRVACVSDGVAAMAFLADAAPDLVITDSGTPPFDGIGLADYIRNDPSSRDPRVPIIMACGRADAISSAAAHDAGVNELLVKPLSLKVLRKSICNAVLRARPSLGTADYFGPDRRRRANGEIGPGDLPSGGRPARGEPSAIDRNQLMPTP